MTKTICENCVHTATCKDEGHLDPALTFCADRVSISVTVPSAMEDPGPTAQEIWKEEMEYDAREYMASLAEEDHGDVDDEW